VFGKQDTAAINLSVIPQDSKNLTEKKTATKT
jgi:hypothetical protein